MRAIFGTAAARRALACGAWACSAATAASPPPPPTTSTESSDASVDGPPHDAAPSADVAADANGDAADCDAGADPAVRFVGRIDTSDPAGPKLGWTGNRVVARFDGTSVSVKLAHETIAASLGCGTSRLDVMVDGARQAAPRVLQEGTADHPLATGLPTGTHTIELWRRTEANVGTIPFLGLEFLGDSSSNGYGIDGNGPACSFSAATEDEHEAFPALVAIDLGADHHDLSYAGRGIPWNYARATDPDVYSVVYPRTLPLLAGSTFDFTSYTPDLVWMTLGGNDWDMPNAGDPPPDLATFQKHRKMADEAEAVIERKTGWL